eukprot:Tbor_TRINITY_DN4561_c0_g1::TRINITY_DN4561_c0_g1_i2::g.15746::m.15746
MNNYTTYHFPAVESDLLLDQFQRVRITFDALESFFSLVIHSIEFQRCLCTAAVPLCVNSGSRFANVDYATLLNHLPSVNQALPLAVENAKFRFHERIVASQNVQSGASTISSSRLSNSSTRNSSLHPSLHGITTMAPCNVQSLLQRFENSFSGVETSMGERRSPVPLYTPSDEASLIDNDLDDFINISIKKNGSSDPYSKGDRGKSEDKSRSDAVTWRDRSLVSSHCAGGGSVLSSTNRSPLPSKKQIPKIPGIPFVLIVRIIIQEPGFGGIFFSAKRKPLEEWRFHCLLTESDIISSAACATPGTPYPQSENTKSSTDNRHSSNSYTRADSVSLHVDPNHKHHHKDTILSNDPLQIKDLLAFIEERSFESFCVSSVAEGKLLCSMMAENLIFDVLSEYE